MVYVKINLDDELRKAARGRKTKVPLPMLLHTALRGYRRIQKQIAKAFDIAER